MVSAIYFLIVQEKKYIYCLEKWSPSKYVNCWVYIHHTILSTFLFEKLLNKRWEEKIQEIQDLNTTLKSHSLLLCFAAFSCHNTTLEPKYVAVSSGTLLNFNGFTFRFSRKKVSSGSKAKPQALPLTVTLVCSGSFPCSLGQGPG